MTYLRTYNARVTPQSEPIPNSTQVANSAGGHAWLVDDWVRLDRFLILGSEGGSYYADEPTLTRANAKAVQRCIDADGRRTVDRIVEISKQGRAPKNDPALFALALATAAPNSATRAYALANLSAVARIGTHLFHFAAFVEQFRGWGRSLREAIGSWYLTKEPDQLAYQIIKYQQRDGWSHRDLLRLSHPSTVNAARNAIFSYAVKGELTDGAPYPDLLLATEALKTSGDPKTAARLIRAHRLPREAVPTELLTEATVWDALLDDMPMTALIRNLATLTRVGLLNPLGGRTHEVAERITNVDALTKARVHPIQILAALTTYSSGQGARGNNTWEPIREIVDALDAAFYLAFQNVQPSNKRTLLSLDISGSMDGGMVAGVPGLTPRIASAAMALITAATEPQYAIGAFTTEYKILSLSPKQRLGDLVQFLRMLRMGGTDCALPMLWALQNKIEVDTFVIYTDSETWAGNIHPVQALRQYREQTGIPAKLIVVGMVSNEFSIADSDDGGMLDVVGFDTVAPALIADFARQ